MSRRANIINSVLTYLVTILFFVLIIAVGQRHNSNFWSIVFLMLAGSVASGILVTFFHEFGHLIFGKLNGFAFSSICVFIFKWTKVNKKTVFSFAMFGNQLGFTEMIPKYSENIEKRYARMTFGALVVSIVPTLLGVIPLFLTSLPAWAFCLWATLLPVGIYSLLDNGLPISNFGVRNDGAVLCGLRRRDSSSQVMVNLLKIQAELYQGKTPSEIEESLYFNLPQLPEDDVNFFLILNARYNYYLDKKDYEKAKVVTERLLSLEEYAQEQYMLVAKADALYNACTFDFNEDVADDLTYELEKYLNYENNLTNLRVKLAYILFVQGERDAFEYFYKKINKEALNCQIKGQGLFELKLLERIKAKLDI